MASADVARANVEAFNAGDWEGVAATFASECVYDEVGTQRRLEGQDAILEAYRGWKEAFPDAKGRIDRTIADNGTVTLELTWEGSHSGGPLRTPGGDIAPSNRHFAVRAAQVFEIDGDRIRESHHYFDMMTLLQQLGAGG